MSEVIKCKAISGCTLKEHQKAVNDFLEKIIDCDVYKIESVSPEKGQIVTLIYYITKKTEND